MKRVIFYIGLVIVTCIFLFLMLPLDNDIKNIAKSYYIMDNRSMISNSKEAFRNYSEYNYPKAT